MSKRYRFFIVFATMVICFVFLSPTLRWYFLVPKLEKTRALGSREQIKNYASQTAQLDLQKLISQAQAGEGVPPELAFLTTLAKKNYKNAKLTAPAQWDARAVLASFVSREEAQDAIETSYRDRIFDLKNLQKNAVQLGLDLSGGLSIVLQADLDALKEKVGHDLSEADREDAVNRALEVLNSRIDRFGLTEPVIRRQGQDQIYVEIPGSRTRNGLTTSSWAGEAWLSTWWTGKRRIRLTPTTGRILPPPLMVSATLSILPLYLPMCLSGASIPRIATAWMNFRVIRPSKKKWALTAIISGAP
jgi:hypothetical protein